ncbi:tetratricopeptide repeat protein [bacterium]|nr:tetratricopeptide repeat protein [bacterium]
MKMVMKKFWILGVALLVIYAGCDCKNSVRKIHLAETDAMLDTGHSTTTLALNDETRLSLAVCLFQCDLEDTTYQWLEAAIPEMLIRSLSQSRLLNVMTMDRLKETMERLRLDCTGKTAVKAADIVAISREANVQFVLTGQIGTAGKKIRLQTQLRDGRHGMLLNEQSVGNPNLENVFSMVDALTAKIREDLQLSGDHEDVERSVADLSTNSLEAWHEYSRGLTEHAKINYIGALKHFENAVIHDSTFVAAYLELNRLYNIINNYDKVDSTFQKLTALRSKATRKEEYHIDYLGAIRERQVLEMLQTMRAWLAEFPNDLDALTNIALLYMQLQNYEQALLNFERVIEIDPNNKLAYNHLGYCYALSGNFNYALVALKEYRKLAPDEPNPYDSMGDTYRLMGDWQQAAENYQLALVQNPEFMASFVNLGLTYFYQGDDDRAEQTYIEFARKWPGNYMIDLVNERMGLLKWRQKKYDQAIEIYKDIYPRNFGRTYAWANRLNRLYTLKGDSVAAHGVVREAYIESYKNLLRQPKNLKLAANLCAISLWYDFEPDKSIHRVERTLEQTEINADQITARFLLTLLYQKTGRWKLVDGLWNEIPPEILVEFFEESTHLSFGSTWRYFTLMNYFFHDDFQRGFTFYEKMSQNMRREEADKIASIFDGFLSDIYQQAGRTKDAEQLMQQAGTPLESKWMVIGPFPNDNGFNQKFPPEEGIDLNEAYPGSTGDVRWQHANDTCNESYVNFQKIYGPEEWNLAYALIYVYSDGEQLVQLRFGADDESRVWLNDRQVWRSAGISQANFDEHQVPVKLKSGNNKILVKVTNFTDLWGFYFRITDGQGAPVSGLDYKSADKML